MKITDSPLGLTVHSLPTIDARTSTGRIKMLAVLFICSLPVIASYLTYYVIRPTHSELLRVKSFGELVQPQRPMPDIMGTTLGGLAQPLQALRGQWLLVSVSGGACDKQCQAHLYMQRQLRETLGAEKDRLDWVWFITDNAQLPPELQARLTDPLMKTRGFDALRLKASDLATWLDGNAARLYLIDPQGNYMMRFPENVTLEQAAKVKADISKLLRASSFWDTPGRDNVKLKK